MLDAVYTSLLAGPSCLYAFKSKVDPAQLVSVEMEISMLIR